MTIYMYASTTCPVMMPSGTSGGALLPDCLVDWRAESQVIIEGCVISNLKSSPVFGIDTPCFVENDAL
jgi:hypothetical protein